MPTVIQRCSCKHEHQDKYYGSGMRVYNTLKIGSNKARCSVCKTEKTVLIDKEG